MIHTIADTKEGKIIRLENKNMRLELTDYGAAIFGLYIKQADGTWEAICRSFSDLIEFKKNDMHFGATVGPVNGRIGGAHFKIDNEEYNLDKNDEDSCLHGGAAALGRKMWNTAIYGEKVEFSTISPDGEGGFPGNVEFISSYEMSDEGTITLCHIARTDKPTYVGMTNHIYWRLGGENQNLSKEKLYINADYYLPFGKNLVPTGEILKLKGTSHDFSSLREIGQEQNLDHSFVRKDRGFGVGAILEDDIKNIRLTVSTTLPDIHVFTYEDSICIEAQPFPNAANMPHLGKALIRPGEEYNEIIVMKIE